MKIASFETFVVGNPPPHFGGRYFIFVKLVTDDGIVGYGEVYAATFSGDVIARMTEDVAERWFVGQDPRTTTVTKFVINPPAEEGGGGLGGLGGFGGLTIDDGILRRVTESDQPTRTTRDSTRGR